MQDLERGASHDPDARLKGEILASLSTWTADYDLVRLELAWTVVQMLLRHVKREQPLDVYLEFVERLANNLRDQSEGIRSVISEDTRRRAN